MISIESWVPRDLKSMPSSGRKPLQPKNINADGSLLTPKPKAIGISPRIGEADKENLNLPLSVIGSFDASLAEELVAVRRRAERLRMEKEKTEKVLGTRDMALEKAMGDLKRRGREQRNMEMEVDKIFRLKELKDSCLRIRPIRSLRERENEKIKESLPQAKISCAKENEESSVEMDGRISCAEENEICSVERDGSTPASASMQNREKLLCDKVEEVR